MGKRDREKTEERGRGGEERGGGERESERERERESERERRRERESARARERGREKIYVLEDGEQTYMATQAEKAPQTGPSGTSCLALQALHSLLL